MKVYRTKQEIKNIATKFVLDNIDKKWFWYRVKKVTHLNEATFSKFKKTWVLSYMVARVIYDNMNEILDSVK